MAFIFGNDYGGLMGNVLQTQQADANNFWRFADANRQSGQDVFGQQLAQAKLKAEAEDRARQMAQFNFSSGLDMQRLALAKTAEERQARAEATGERRADTAEALGQRHQKLAEQQFDFTKGLPTPTQERGAELLFKSALELADQGALKDEDIEDFPEDHQQILLLHNERAQKLASGQKSKLEDAADTLNRMIALQHQLAQTEEDIPGKVRAYSAGIFSQPGKRKRMLEGKKAMQDELTQVSSAASGVTPDIKSHLRMNRSGWWEPNFELPWAAVGAAGPAPMTSGTATGGGSFDDQYAALPRGATYRDPTGQMRIKQ